MKPIHLFSIIAAILFFTHQASAEPVVSPADPIVETNNVLEVQNRPGISPDKPILPVSAETFTGESGLPRTSFEINIPDIFGSTFIYIDPVVAIGYDYIVDEGPKFTGVTLPQGFGDDMYDLWLLDAKIEEFVDSGIDIPAGKEYQFKEPVTEFSIRGIEMVEKVDPSYGIAFPTGVAFAEDADFVKMRMISVTADAEQEKE